MKTKDVNNRKSDHGSNSRGTGLGVGAIGNHGRFNPYRPFSINQVVRHIGTGIKLTVIAYGREQVQCRKPDLSSDYFYVHELEAIEDDTK